MIALTPRGRALRWLTNHRGITENPPGSNLDNRKDGIRAAQLRVARGGTWLVGQAWCGVWACAAALHAGVSIPKPWRWASVVCIEDDARAGTNGFLKWVTNVPGRERGKVLRADLVVLFGRGIHVETFREFLHDSTGKVVAVVTDGGNTSSGPGGSQDKGGGAFPRVRPIGDVHGFARVDYPRFLSRATA